MKTTDVFEALGGDHAEIKQMLDALESSPGNSSGATSHGYRTP